jgi:hypothetical protein
MHRSRLAGFIIDCNTDNIEEAGEFWAAALGMQARYNPAVEGDNYVRLNKPDDRFHVEVQKVSHESRVHLDIETDDIDAEVRRLEQLGVTEVRRVKSWCVMQAPTGQRFCVVKTSAAMLDAEANSWS